MPEDHSRRFESLRSFAFFALIILLFVYIGKAIIALTKIIFQVIVIFGEYIVNSIKDFNNEIRSRKVK